MIVGVYRTDDDDDQMVRVREYSPEFGTDRFAAHEKFFVEDPVVPRERDLLGGRPEGCRRGRRDDRVGPCAWGCVLAGRLSTDGGLGVRTRNIVVHVA